MLQIQVSVIRTISKDALNFSPGRVDTKAFLAVSSLFCSLFGVAKMAFLSFSFSTDGVKGGVETKKNPTISRKSRKKET